MILSPAQLEELTGYRRGHEQIRWLQKNGIRHYIRADGKPAVLPEALAAPNNPTTVRGPRFDALQA